MKINDFRLERYFAEYEFSGAFLMSSSDCEALTVGGLMALEGKSEEGLRKLSLGYTETRGDPWLRKEIAGLYRGVEADEVLVFSGAEEAIFVVMNLLAEQGFSVIVPVPCYQSLTEVVEAAGGRVVPWYMIFEEERGWRLDVEALERLICPTTRALALNFPHNPTGYMPTLEEQRRIMDIAAKRGLTVFSDEVYRGLEHEGVERLPAVCESYERGISLGVMSKSFGLAGLRIGWLVSSDRELLKRAEAFKDYTSICNSAPSEYLAALALRHKEEILTRNRQIIAGNLQLWEAFATKYHRLIAWNRPQAGSTAFPAFCSLDNCEPFCKKLVEEAGVLLLPGGLYNYRNHSYASHFRIGFGRSDFSRGLAQLENYLSDEKGARWFSTH